MMIKSEAKRWGNSLGIIIPKAVVESEHIREHDKVQFLIIRDGRKALKETFGILKGKLKKPTQKIMKEIRAELYD